MNSEGTVAELSHTSYNRSDAPTTSVGESVNTRRALRHTDTIGRGQAEGDGGVCWGYG